MKISVLSKALFVTLLLLSSTLSPVYAIENPQEKPNNKFGIHILFDSEIEEAAALVNSNGGQWGYVIIPIQSGDRDLEKWQTFMDKAKKLKVTPIVRLATEGDYFNTKVWRKPKEEDVLDFANFLHSLHWPVKNRYVVVFNEVNRDNEWGGTANPKEYAQLLSYASTVFKSLSPDFYILNAGLDNASINGNGAINKLTFLLRMDQAVPGIFNQIDGFNSHAYPNPAFSQPPSVQTVTSISSYRYEKTLITQLTDKTLPVFITETGWSGLELSDKTRAAFYKEAFQGAWSDPDIIAVTPFLLRAGGGPFEQFSFINNEGKPTEQYRAIEKIAKIKGQPTQNSTPTPTPQVLGTETATTGKIPTILFPADEKKKKISRANVATGMFSWFFGL
ncbi:MAG: hypothetical protein RLZZ455_899 [Candidatus Parcubacteria bacterium]|jgi:hypothetical protein